MVAPAFTPSTQEGETGRSLCVQDQPGLEFHDNQDYMEKPYLVGEQKKEEEKKTKMSVSETLHDPSFSIHPTPSFCY